MCRGDIETHQLGTDQWLVPATCGLWSGNVTSLPGTCRGGALIIITGLPLSPLRLSPPSSVFTCSDIWLHPRLHITTWWWSDGPNHQVGVVFRWMILLSSKKRNSNIFIRLLCSELNLNYLFLVQVYHRKIRKVGLWSEILCRIVVNQMRAWHQCPDIVRRQENVWCLHQQSHSIMHNVSFEMLHLQLLLIF